MTPAAVIDALELAGAELAIVRGRVVVRPGPDPVPARLLEAFERHELAVMVELRRREEEATPGAATSPDEEDPAEDVRRLLAIISTARRWLEAVLPYASERVRDVLHPTVRMLDPATNPRLGAVLARARSRLAELEAEASEEDGARTRAPEPERRGPPRPGRAARKAKKPTSRTKSKTRRRRGGPRRRKVHPMTPIEPTAAGLSWALPEVDPAIEALLLESLVDPAIEALLLESLVDPAIEALLLESLVESLANFDTEELVVEGARRRRRKNR